MAREEWLDIVELLHLKFGEVSYSGSVDSANHVLLERSTVMFRCLEQIKELADDPKNLYSIRIVAQHGINAIETLDGSRPRSV